MATRTRSCQHGGSGKYTHHRHGDARMEMVVLAARCAILLYAHHKAQQRARDASMSRSSSIRQRHRPRLHPELVRADTTERGQRGRNRGFGPRQESSTSLVEDWAQHTRSQSFERQTRRDRSPPGLRPTIDHPPSVQRARDLQRRRRAFQHKECSVCGDKPETPTKIYAHLTSSCQSYHNWQDEIICTDCLQHYLEARIFPSDDPRTKYRFPSTRITCWAPNCNAEIATSTLQKYLPTALFATYTSALDAQYLCEDTSTLHCATPSCPGAFWSEPNDNIPTTIFCEQCGHETCTECKDAYYKHRNQPCPSIAAQRRRAKDSRLKREEELSAAVLEKGTRCPSCSLPYLKIGGCDHIVCGKDADGVGPSRGCGHEFCHRCFEPWRRHRAGCAYSIF